MKFDDRQGLAAAIGALGLLIFLPVVVALASLFITGWLWILGIPGGHGMIFGWLSTKQYDAQGHPHFHPSKTIGVYFFVVITVYLLYQVAELLTYTFGLFKDALTK